MDIHGKLLQLTWQGLDQVPPYPNLALASLTLPQLN